MSVNKFQPHVLVLPEDDANRQLANGFVLGVRHDRRIQILPEAGGWTNVCGIFLSDHVKGIRDYDHRHFILLMDFDDQDDRDYNVRAKIPEDVRDRVFLLGTKTEPEALKRAGLGALEEIGRRLAQECHDGTRSVWRHELLRRNMDALDRLNETVRGFLF